MRVGHGWKEWFRPSSAVSQLERNTEICFGACLPLIVSRTSTGDGCLFLLEPRASDLQPMKNKTFHPSEWRLVADGVFFRVENVIGLEARSIMYTVRYAVSRYPPRRLLSPF